MTSSMSQYGETMDVIVRLRRVRDPAALPLLRWSYRPKVVEAAPRRPDST
jgi:hypothetical protein